MNHLCECGTKLVIANAGGVVGGRAALTMVDGPRVDGCPTVRTLFKARHVASIRTGRFAELPAELGTWFDAVGDDCDWTTYFDDQMANPYYVGFSVNNPMPVRGRFIDFGVRFYSNSFGSFVPVETNGTQMHPDSQFLGIYWNFRVPVADMMEPLPTMWVQHAEAGEYAFTVMLAPR